MYQSPPSINRQFYQPQGAKILYFSGICLALIFTLLGIAFVSALIINAVKGGASSSLVTLGIVGAVFAILGILALIKLMPRFQRPVDYTPRFLGIGPHAYGHPFDVRLLRKTFGPSFRGQGVVQFFPDHLIVDGHREINSYIQLGVFLLLTAVPLLIFQVGLSTLVAAIIAIAIGRKKLIQSIPYHAIRAIALDGNTVTIECAGLSPAKIVFYVASPDGERLQGEIAPRFAPILRRTGQQ